MKTAHFLMCGVAASAFSSASFGQTIPFPVATHPRLWVTSKDVSRLRTWAVSTNPIYSKGMGPLLAQAVNIYKTQFFPGGVQNPNYPDLGDTQGYQGLLTEQEALIFALHSLIDPNPTNRIQYAQCARNLIMVAMNQAALGPMSNVPFRDPLPPISDLSSAQMLEAIRHDKKVVAGRQHDVLPTAIGAWVIVDDVTEKEIRAALLKMGFRK